ncbi:MAG: hypothetical protein H7X95_11535 [Deltaproteobacteria bacterium]|nr:hypothetical protein [Deltaproteobacteria bacterium]
MSTLSTIVFSAVIGATFSGQVDARAAEADPWLGADKALHFSACAAIAGGSYGVAAAVTDNRRWRLVTGALSGLAAGATKEAIDASGAGDPSWRDFTWDVIGTATGVAMAAAIDWWLSR